MKIKLDFRKSARENANAYFEKAKEARRKAQGAKAALALTTAKIAEAESENGGAAAKKGAEMRLQVKVKREKEWHEKFHWFVTNAGHLVIAGRDAAQNDLIYAKYLDDADLFFHADIQGAPATVLKIGKSELEKAKTSLFETNEVGLDEKKEVAQFAASYSSAWKVGTPSVHVYCVKKLQLTKHSHGGFIPKGGFGITGEREWFRGTRLGIKIGNESGNAIAVPLLSKTMLENACEIVPGVKQKGEVVKIIAKRTGAHPDDINALLPSGKSTCRYI